MSSVSEVPVFFDQLRSRINNHQVIDWFIVRALSELFEGTNDLYFSLHDNRRTHDLPFRRHQGYLCVEETLNTAFIMAFSQILNDVLEQPLSLANLYILYTRVSGGEEAFIEELTGLFTNMAQSKREQIFLTLADSLNQHYFAHTTLARETPKTVQDWLNLFRAAQGFDHISDPVIRLIRLIEPKKRQYVPYTWVLHLKPVVRAPLMGWYHFQLDCPSDELITIISNDASEAAYVGAVLMNEMGPTSITPDWLNQYIIAIFVKQCWSNVGKAVFMHIYGLSYRNKNENPLFKTLEALFHKMLLELIQSSKSEDDVWLTDFDLPDTYIAFFNWITVNQIKFSEIPRSKGNLLIQTFINQLAAIAAKPEVYFTGNSSDPWKSYALTEMKYLNTISYLLLYLLDTPAEQLKEMTKVFFNFKPLYFGEYTATYFANRFTEFILLILTAINNLHDLTEEMLQNLDGLLKGLADSVLIPYIHLTERESEIWDLHTNRQPMAHNASKYLINDALKSIRQGHYADHYKNIFDLFDAVKVTEWPYERT